MRRHFKDWWPIYMVGAMIAFLAVFAATMAIVSSVLTGQDQAVCRAEGGSVVDVGRGWLCVEDGLIIPMEEN